MRSIANTLTLLTSLALRSLLAEALVTGDVIGPTFADCPTSFAETIGVRSLDCGAMGGTWHFDVRPSDASTLCAWSASAEGSLRVVVQDGSGNCTLDATTNLDVVFPGDLLSIAHTFVTDPVARDAENAANFINAASLPITFINSSPTTVDIFGSDPNSPIDIHLVATNACQRANQTCTGSGVDFAISYISGPAPLSTNVIPTSSGASVTSTSTGSPTSPLRLQAVADQHCPTDTQKCLVTGTTNAWECIDTQNELASCGGCTSEGSGVNCEALPNVRLNRVMCLAGVCHVNACEEGFQVAAAGGSCEKI